MEGDFGNIIGFLIFAVIAVLSIINKIREQRKAGEEQPEEHEPSLEDLPELARRLLYGDKEPDKAEAEPAKTAPPPVSEQPVMRPVILEVPRRTLAETEKAPATPPVPPEGWEGPYEPPVQPPRMSKRQRKQQEAAAKQKKIPQPAPKAQPPVVTTPKPRRSTGPVRLDTLFATKNQVRNGILYYEILGPPKALREGRK
jgi:hypothetical protein